MPGPCRACGEPISLPRAGVCSDACRVWWLRYGRVMGRAAGQCDWCSAPIGPTRRRPGQGQYCSRACAYEARKRKQYPVAHRPCDVCGVQLTTTHPKVRYCSRSCRLASPTSVASDRAKEARRRARKRGATVLGRVVPTEIADRDGWVCGICDGPIDELLRWPHPGSLSMDHVVPLAMAGPHEPSNVQAAHLRCNVAKGCRMEVAS